MDIYLQSQNEQDFLRAVNKAKNHYTRTYEKFCKINPIINKEQNLKRYLEF